MDESANALNASKDVELSDLKTEETSTDAKELCGKTEEICGKKKQCCG